MNTDKPDAVEREKFAENLYDCLRSYQKGEYDDYMVSVGQLGSPLTQVFDLIGSLCDDQVTAENDRLKKEVEAWKDALRTAKTRMFSIYNGDWANSGHITIASFTEEAMIKIDLAFAALEGDSK